MWAIVPLKVQSSYITFLLCNKRVWGSLLDIQQSLCCYSPPWNDRTSYAFLFSSLFLSLVFKHVFIPWLLISRDSSLFFVFFCASFRLTYTGLCCSIYFCWNISDRFASWVGLAVSSLMAASHLFSLSHRSLFLVFASQWEFLFNHVTRLILFFFSHLSASFAMLTTSWCFALQLLRPSSAPGRGEVSGSFSYLFNTGRLSLC